MKYSYIEILFVQPLYGLIKAKLELITHAYFDERDFSKVELLEQTFNNLNASLTESLLSSSSQIFLGKCSQSRHCKLKLLNAKKVKIHSVWNITELLKTHLNSKTQLDVFLYK